MPTNSKSWDRVQQAFEGALEFPQGPERDEYLQSTLGDDADLLGEVSAMLQAHEGLAPLEIEKRLLSADEPDLSGTVIGTYRLVKLIAKGGMGEVYAAAREGGQYRQQVALKLLRQGLSGAEARLRFRQERQILAKLIHPQIVPLLDGGVTEEGRPYLVLQLVDGQPVTAYCDDRACGIEVRLRLLCDVARAVDYAHRNLVVHRDLKPSNILVTAEGQARLLDFGVAKMLDPPAEEEAPVTRLDVRIMTLDYAAPEQVRGDSITTATDTYALGALLYELLAGRRPFVTSTEGRTSLERRILDDEPEPPSVAARQNRGEAWSKKLRGDLDTIVLKAMAKEPERRYSSAEEIARDIERHLAGEPVLARKPSLRYRLEKFTRRNRLATAVSVVSLVLLLSLTGMIWIQSRRVARERDLARSEQEKAGRVVSLLVDLFSTANPEHLPGGSDLTIGEFLKRAEATLLAKRDVDPDVQARLRHTLGKVHMARSQFEEARGHFEAALEQLRRVKGEKDPATAEVFHDLAKLVARAETKVKAEPLLRQSLELHRALYGENHESVAQCMQDLGAALGDSGEKQKMLEGALAIRRRLFPNPNMSVVGNLNELGIFHFGREETSLAERYFEEAVRIVRQVAPPGHPGGLAAMSNLSVIRQRQARFEEAERLEIALLEEKRRVIGEETLQVAISLGNLGTVQANEGKHAEAEESFRKALALFHKLLGREHAHVANATRNLGVIRMRRGSFGQASEILRQAAEVQKSVNGMDVEYWYMLCQAAVATAHSGRTAEAIRSFRFVLEKIIPFAQKQPSRLASVRVALGFALLDQGQADEAETLLRDALEVRRKSMTANHPSIAEAECGLGAALAMQNKPDGLGMVKRSLPAYRRWGLADSVYVSKTARWLPQ